MQIVSSTIKKLTKFKEAALKTKTKMDDGIIDLVLEAVMEKSQTDSIIPQ